jgi:peptidylprolyl isomerase
MSGGGLRDKFLAIAVPHSPPSPSWSRRNPAPCVILAASGWHGAAAYYSNRRYGMRMSRLVIAAACLAATPAVTRGQDTIDPAKMTTTNTGLRYQDQVAGQGKTPATGQTCVMHYTGWLWENGKKGKKFDSSVDRGEPFEFAIGVGQVIAGWDEGVGTMKVGGKRLLLIPPALGYGARGAGGVIPPNATLIFDVQLLGLK